MGTSLVIAISGLAIGQSCASTGVGYRGATGYATQTYAATAYHAPAYHNFVGFVAVSPYYSSTVGAAARAEAQAQVAASAQLALTTQLGTLAGAIADLKAQVNAGNAPLGPPTSPVAQPPPPPPAPRGVARPNAPAAFVGVLAKSCGSCHNPQKKSGGLSFFDAPGVLAALSIQDKLDMLDSVKAGRMPKTAEKGSPEARRAIAEWIQSDAEQLIASLKENSK